MDGFIAMSLLSSLLMALAGSRAATGRFED